MSKMAVSRPHYEWQPAEIRAIRKACRLYRGLQKTKIARKLQEEMPQRSQSSIYTKMMEILKHEV